MPGPNRFTEGLLEFADVVASDLANNGEIRVNLGDATTGGGIDSRVPFWGTDGFLSRPADPTPAGACQYLFVAEGNTRYAIGSRDRRFLPFAPQSETPILPGLDTRGLDSGDRIVYTPGGVAVVLDESAKTLTLYNPTDGFKLKLGDDGVDVTGFAPNTFNVALYPTLQLQVNSLQSWVDVLCSPTGGILPVLITASVLAPPAKATLLAALATAYAALTTANTTEADETQASSSCLRASTS